MAAAVAGSDDRPPRGRPRSSNGSRRATPMPGYGPPRWAPGPGSLTRRRPRGSGRLPTPEPAVRRRAAEIAPAFTVSPTPLPGLRPPTVPGGCREVAKSPGRLVELAGDADTAVAEAAAWALGELGPAARRRCGRVTCRLAGSHGDALVREAAVAALGSLGDPGGLPAVLAACNDKPAIRRRAVLALAAFEGPEVDAALEAALADKDWQTRQAAEDLLGPRVVARRAGQGETGRMGCSPRAQSVPPSQSSAFQMGTASFRVSMQ